VEWSRGGLPPLVNDAALTRRMVPTLQRVAGGDKAFEARPATASEDFSLFAQEVPGFFYRVGITPPDLMGPAAASNHSPRFRVDEAGLLPALRATVHIAFDYMATVAK
jgi:metal-dependent amidase/aminoacylase/carboxypeptidase family protein